MGWTNDLLDGIAQHLHDAGAGIYTPETAYPEDSQDVVIVVGHRPDHPDRVIAIADYTPDGRNTRGDVARQVQVWMRGAEDDPGSLNDIRDTVEDALDGLAWVKWNGIAVQQIYLGPRAELGDDDNQRTEATSNFTVQARRLTAYRTA